MIDPTLEAILADIARCWQASQTPSPLREKLVRWAEENKEHVDRLKCALAGHAAWWIVMGRKEGHDPDVLDQVALQTMQWAIALVARAMKARQGEPFEPARVAIVAYAVAQDIAAAPDVVDIDGLAAATDALAGAISEELSLDNERLRSLVAEIAQAGTGETEMMEQAWIVERCRAEVARWEGGD